MKIQPIIISYNMPSETDALFCKLTKEGFKEILVVDNHSNAELISKNANMHLPKNIFFAGAARVALSYAMDYSPADYYWILTTSVELLDDIQYLNGFNRAFSHLNNIGSLTPAVIRVNNQGQLSYCQEYEKNKTGYVTAFFIEPLASLVSHEVLLICRSQTVSYFDTRYRRGWGCEVDYQYAALKNGKLNFISQSIPIRWHCNVLYKRNLAEPLVTYYELAGKEFREIMSSNYGSSWKETLSLNFDQALFSLKKSLPNNVIICNNCQEMFI